MNLIIDSLESSAEIAATAAEFGKPLSKIDIEVLEEDGFSAARGFARHCMGWIWRQWLLGRPPRQIHTKVRAFVDKGMEMQTLSSQFYMRPLADLYLMHCAIFGSSRDQLERLASRVVDTSGVKGHKPKDDGELYASAWCGMLKHSILGNAKEAEEQSEFIWNAYHPPSFSAATKPLVTPWLKGDWKSFVRAQQKDFNKLWVRARKDGTVRSETGDEIVVTVERYPIEQKWCWAHCGLALLAHRRGEEVATDPFWLPTGALRIVNVLK